MASEHGAVVLTFNGEIYNFRELRAELESNGHRFRGHSDTEVLLHLYLAEGDGLLGRLNGIFAFALWDRRNRTICMARNGVMGVTQLYYSEIHCGIVFACLSSAGHDPSGGLWRAKSSEGNSRFVACAPNDHVAFIDTPDN